MTKEQMQEEINGLTERNTEIINSYDELRKTIRTLEITNKRLMEHKVERLYLEGQVSVLKRISGLYPEEEMTHEEWMKTDREILSEKPLPF